MMAEWVEDDNVWLTQRLIASCVGTTVSCGEDLKEFNSDKSYAGEFFAGLDLSANPRLLRSLSS